MKNWNVTQRVTWGFALIILISAAICAFAVLRMTAIQKQALNIQRDAVPSLHYSAELGTLVSTDFALLLEVVYVTNRAARVELDTRLQAFSRDFDTALASLEPAMSGEAMDRQSFLSVKANRDEYLQARKRVLDLNVTGKADEARSTLQQELSASHGKLDKVLDDIINKHNLDATAAATQIATDVSFARWVLLIGSFASLAACLLIAGSVIRSLSNTLSKLMSALLQVNSSATEMAATLKQQQSSANEVASTSVEIGATAKEISATSKEFGKTMSDVAGVAENTAQLAGGGQAGLSRMEATMGQVLQAAGTISAKLAILNDKTTNISSVVTTINKVADQTNLLSLNAAIEAEKAGAHGQGFAVVATEIRRLADQTAVATYDIEQMVKEMQSAVAAGVMSMDKFNEEVRKGSEDTRQVTIQLAQIIQQVQALTPRFESVNEGMQSQSTAAGQISDALGQLGEVAQQSAQALRQNTEALQELTSASHGLKEAMAQLKSVDSEATVRSPK
jgi:methyl-accepting chemotaxis protein WspA